MTKLETIVQRRQLILDTLHAHGAMRGTQLAVVAGLDANTALSTLYGMLTADEVIRSGREYTAAVRTTRSADSINAARVKKQVVREKSASNSRKGSSNPAHIIHICSDTESRPSADRARRSTPARGYSPIMGL